VCGEVDISTPFVSALLELRAVEYGREGHPGLTRDVLINKGDNYTNLCIYFIPINIFCGFICLNVKLTQEIDFWSLPMNYKCSSF